MSNFQLFSHGRRATPGGVVKSRKPYRRPELEVLGDLRTMTLGVSPSGTKDSGGGSLYEYNGSGGDLLPPGFPIPPEFEQLP